MRSPQTGGVYIQIVKMTGHHLSLGAMPAHSNWRLDITALNWHGCIQVGYRGFLNHFRQVVCRDLGPECSRIGSAREPVGRY